MSRKSTDKKLARAVQAEVMHRRAGAPPSYGHCLNLVREELDKLGDGARPDTWQADLVERVAARTS
jgi:hypothetical protein